MENNTPYNLDFSVVKVLSLAEIFSERCEFSCVNSLTFFTALVCLEEYPLSNWLIVNRISPVKVSIAIAKILRDYYLDIEKEDIDGEIKFDIVNFSVYVSSNIYDIIEEADNVAKNQYGKDEIGYNELLVAFIECYPEVFDLFLKYCNLVPVPDNKIKKEEESMGMIIPHELAGCLTVLNNSPIATSDIQEILGRDKETLQLIRILAKNTKSNAVFIGEPGVGKTAVVENFAWLIVSGNCPDKFKNSILISLDVNSIIAGTHFRGSAEERFKILIDFLERYPNCILFIDEIHNLLGAGACRDGDLDLANALKPILSRGNTQVIGATTTDEYVRYFSRDGALKRRFEKIVINEPKVTEIYPMIRNKVKRLSEGHGVTISKELVDKIIFYASCFNFETKNPDRTLDLVDKAMAIAELNGKKEVSLDDVIDNFDVNIKKYEKMSIRDKTSTAYHEAGHYILLRFAPELYNHKVTAVSIMPADGYLGVNALEIDHDITVSETREYFIQLLASRLAGRIAEMMYTGTISAGACGDLTANTKIAHNMVTKYLNTRHFLVEKIAKDIEL